MEEVSFGYLQENELKETFDLCMRSFGTDFPYEEIREVYQRCKDDPHYHFIVGKANGKIVAYTTMVMFYNLFDGNYPIASLWYVCVDKDYRRQGVATRMFSYIEDIAKQHQCELICLSSLQDNVSSHDFYRSIGYSDTKEKAFVKYFFDCY